MRKKKEELRRVIVGFAIIGGVSAPFGAFLWYRIDWSDGTASVERGNTVFSLPGMLPVGSKMPPDVRPDLGAMMSAVHTLMDPIQSACYRLDEELRKPKKKPRGRKRKTL